MNDKLHEWMIMPLGLLTVSATHWSEHVLTAIPVTVAVLTQVLYILRQVKALGASRAASKLEKEVAQVVGAVADPSSPLAQALAAALAVSKETGWKPNFPTSATPAEPSSPTGPQSHIVP